MSSFHPPPTKHHFLTQHLTTFTPPITHSPTDCPICLDAISPSPLADFSLPLFPSLTATTKPSVQITSCAHTFHYDCLTTWLDEHDTCPSCRRVLFDSLGLWDGSGDEVTELEQMRTRESRDREWMYSSSSVSASASLRDQETGLRVLVLEELVRREERRGKERDGGVGKRGWRRWFG